MPKFHNKSVLIVLVALICIGGSMPSESQAKTYLGHRLLSKNVSVKGTLKWKIKNTYLKKVTYNKALLAKGNVTLGNATSDSVKVNGTVTSALGVVEIDDDVHVTGNLTLDNPLAATELSDSGLVKALTAGDNVTITDNGSGNFTVASAGLDSSAIEAGDIEAGDLPSDGYASTYVNTSGDSMTGALNITSGSIVDNGVLRQLNAQLNIPDAGSTVTLDSAIGSLAGSQPMAITIGTDGMPVVVYWDAADQDITLVHCTDRACSATDTAVDLDTTSTNRSDVAIMIGSDGFPFIAHFDSDDGDSSVVHCSNVSCTSSTTTDIDTSGGSFSGGYSMLVGTDGFPVISYFDGDGGGNLMLNHCANVACTSSSTAVEIDGNVGSSIVSTSMIMNVNGIPMIAYADENDTDVTIATCTTATCTAVTTSVIDSTVTSAGPVSFTVNSLGNPLLAYYDTTDSDLTVFSCTTFDCSNGTTLSDIDTSATAGSVWVTINPTSTLPVILYADASDSILHLVTCQSHSCNDTFPTITSVYSAGIFGGQMVFGADSNPLLLYSDPSTDTVILEQCSNAYCQDYWTRR